MRLLEFVRNGGSANDFAGFAGPATEGTITENFLTMTELAKLHGIRVVLASVTPICDCFALLSARRPPGRNMRQELTVDGLIPNGKGYALMAPVAEKAIAEALR